MGGLWRLPPRGSPAPGEAPTPRRPGSVQPGGDLVGVLGHPVLAGLLGIDLVAGDRLGDELLVVVGQLHLAEDVVRRRAALRELLREELLDDGHVIGALVLRGVAAGFGVVLAAGLALG